MTEHKPLTIQITLKAPLWPRGEATLHGAPEELPTPGTIAAKARQLHGWQTAYGRYLEQFMNQQLRDELERAERNAALEAYQRLAAARGTTRAAADTVLGMVQKWRGTSWRGASVDEIQEAEQVLKAFILPGPPTAERERLKRLSQRASDSLALRTPSRALPCQCRLQASSARADRQARRGQANPGDLRGRPSYSRHD
ncbi:hypothetical protein ACIQMP_07745 [Streptomyces sp. NPDC091385]|uniref:hypothetical protein n=1 Tax=Streptomyces sp. NPDC091385 TaxID=3365997 RepID=UPI00381E6D3A